VRSCRGHVRHDAVRFRTVLRLLLLAVLTQLSACADSAADYRILFGESESRLSPDEMAAAFALVKEGLTVSDDGLRLEDANCGDMVPTSEIVDLNRDSIYEIFVEWGNTCTSGMSGRSLALLVRDEAGGYRRELGFPAFGWTALGLGEDGWPDLSIGGPGFCHPVWARRAGSYDFKCNLPESPDGCAVIGNICQ